MIQHSKITKEITNYEFQFELNTSYEELIQMYIQIFFPEEFIPKGQDPHYIKIQFQNLPNTFMFHHKQNQGNFLILLNVILPKENQNQRINPENFNQKQIISIIINNIQNPEMIIDQKIHIKILSIDGASFEYKEQLEQSVRLRDKLYSIQYQQLCSHLLLGFNQKNIFRVMIPEFVPFPFQVKIITDYENYIKINPNILQFKPGIFDTKQDIQIGISPSYHLSQAKIKIMVIGEYENDFEKKQLLFPVIDPLKEFPYTSKFLLDMCFPQLFIYPNIIRIPLNKKTIPIRLELSSSVVKDLSIQNPFASLVKNNILEIQPEKLLIKKNEKEVSFTLKILKEFSYLEGELNLNLEFKQMEFYESIDMMMNFSQLKDIIKDGFEQNNELIQDQYQDVYEKEKHITKQFELGDKIDKINKFISKNIDDLKHKNNRIYVGNQILLEPVDKSKQLLIKNFQLKYSSDSIVTLHNPIQDTKKYIMRLSHIKKIDSLEDKNIFKIFTYENVLQLQFEFNQFTEVCLFFFNPFFSWDYYSFQKIHEIGRNCFKSTSDSKYFFDQRRNQEEIILRSSTRDSNKPNFMVLNISQFIKNLKVRKNFKGFLFFRTINRNTYIFKKILQLQCISPHLDSNLTHIKSFLSYPQFIYSLRKGESTMFPISLFKLSETEKFSLNMNPFYQKNELKNQQVKEYDYYVYFPTTPPMIYQNSIYFMKHNKLSKENHYFFKNYFNDIKVRVIDTTNNSVKIAISYSLLFNTLFKKFNWSLRIYLINTSNYILQKIIIKHDIQKNMMKINKYKVVRKNKKFENRQIGDTVYQLFQSLPQDTLDDNVQHQLEIKGLENFTVYSLQYEFCLRDHISDFFYCQVEQENLQQFFTHDEIIVEIFEGSFLSKFKATTSRLWREAFPTEIDIREKHRIAIEEAKKKKEELAKLSEEELEQMIQNQEKEESLYDTKTLNPYMRFPYRKNPDARSEILFVQDKGTTYKTEIFEMIKLYFGMRSKYYYKRQERLKELTGDNDEIKRPLNKTHRMVINEIAQLRKTLQQIQDSVSSNYDDSTVVQQYREIREKIKSKMNNEVITYMNEHYPDFDYENFEKEIEVIFEGVYNAFLEQDLKTLSQTCIAEGMTYFRGQIEAQKTQGIINKYKNIFNLEKPILQTAVMAKKNQPVFVFSLKFHQLHCMVDVNDPEKVVEGKDGQKVLNEMMLYIMEHPEPDVEQMGHKWAIVNIVSRNKVDLLM